MPSRNSTFIIPQNLTAIKRLLSNIMEQIDIIQGNIANNTEKAVITDNQIDTITGQVKEQQADLTVTYKLATATEEAMKLALEAQAVVNNSLTLELQSVVSGLGSQAKNLSYIDRNLNSLINRVAVLEKTVNSFHS